MAKHCPLINAACKEEDCQFWFNTKSDHFTCALVAIPLFLRDIERKQPIPTRQH